MMAVYQSIEVMKDVCLMRMQSQMSPVHKYVNCIQDLYYKCTHYTVRHMYVHAYTYCTLPFIKYTVCTIQYILIDMYLPFSGSCAMRDMSGRVETTKCWRDDWRIKKL